MGTLGKNAAKGTLLAGKGVKAAAGWVVLTLVVVKVTLMSGIFLGPAALVIPVVYVLFAGEQAVNNVRNYLESVAGGA